MAPHGDPMAKRFTFVLHEDERQMLDAIAEQESRSPSDWLRLVIRSEYERRFGKAKPTR